MQAPVCPRSLSARTKIEKAMCSPREKSVDLATRPAQANAICTGRCTLKAAKEGGGGDGKSERGASKACLGHWSSAAFLLQAGNAQATHMDATRRVISSSVARFVKSWTPRTFARVGQEAKAPTLWKSMADPTGTIRIRACGASSSLSAS